MARNSRITLLIDADPLVYQFACGGHKKFDWGDGCISEDIDLGKALERLDEYLHALEDQFDTLNLILALTDAEANFRLDFFPAYKENRRDLERPVMWSAIRDHMLVNYQTFLRPRLEGDDVLGILATSDKIVQGRKIIVAVDKDMQTIPGEHYHPDKDELFQVDERIADYWHMFQTLTGDPVDGYKGCPKIGPVKAGRILEEVAFSVMGIEDEWPEAAWKRVVETYESKGLTEDDALVQARCARILRASDYDFSRKEPILWCPP